MMSVAEYVGFLRRGLWLMLALTIVGAVAAFAYSETQPKIYRSYASAIVVPRQGGTTSELVQGSNYVQNNVQTYSLLAKSPYVLQPVVDQVAPGTPVNALAGRVSVDTPINTTIMNISVTDQSPESAQLLADAVTRSLTRAVSDMAPTINGSPSVRLETIAPATLPQTFVSPDRRLFAIIGGAAGLALAFAASFLREQLRSRPRNAADIASLTDLPVLGEVPPAARGVTLPETVRRDPEGSIAESVRAIAASLRFVSVDRPLKVILVTSPEPADGKSSIVPALGLTMAAAGRRTLLIDADLRNPRLAPTLGIEGAIGLTTVLVGDVALAEAAQPWGDENLWVLTGGAKSPNPGQLISSGQLAVAISQARESFDLVIIDTPPVLPVSDAVWLAPATDGVIVVARARKTPVKALEKTIQSLSATPTPVLGIVLNAVASAASRHYSAYVTPAPTVRPGGLARRASANSGRPSRRGPREE